MSEIKGWLFRSINHAYIKYRLDTRLYRWLAYFFLAKSAYMVWTDRVFFRSLEDEILTQQRDLELHVKQHYQAILDSQASTQKGIK